MSFDCVVCDGSGDCLACEGFGAGEDKPKTVKVRIAVAISPDGDWRAVGNGEHGDDDAEHANANLLGYGNGIASIVWVTAEIPIPEETEVEGEVESNVK